MSERVSVWANKWVSEWVSEWMSACGRERVTEWVTRVHSGNAQSHCCWALQPRGVSDIFDYVSNSTADLYGIYSFELSLCSQRVFWSETMHGITLQKTDVLFLRHATLSIFHELEYCLICMKFPPKITSCTLHTIRKNSIFKKNVLSVKAWMYLNHFDKIVVFKLISKHVSNNFPSCLLWKLHKIIVHETIRKKIVENLSSTFFGVYFHFIPTFFTLIPSYLR
jgi:hypothetical protein